jgi:hypothetical protein
MTGHSRSKNGVASLAYVPVISIQLVKPCHGYRDRRVKPGDDALHHSRDAICIRVLFKRHESLPRTDGRRSFLPPLKTREAERRTAHHGYPHRKEMRARSFATARLSALLRGYALRFVTPTRPGPRFLESPDANGRTLSDASAAGTLQSDHVPDGTMPRPPAS